MEVVQSKLPETSQLKVAGPYDYVDAFETVILDIDNKITSTDIGKAFFHSAPGWAEKLFNFRNKLAKAAGLKSAHKDQNREQLLKKFKCEKGERMGLFQVFDKTDEEVILGENDKHLDFRVSLFIRQTKDPSVKNIIISTTVKFNNSFGKLYFIPVKPFHRLIVPSMLKGIIRELKKRTN